MLVTILKAIWSKFRIPLVAGVAILAGIFAALRQARKDGENQILREQQEKRDDLQRHYDEIDAGPSDPHVALERMRQLGDGTANRDH